MKLKYAAALAGLALSSTAMATPTYIYNADFSAFETGDGAGFITDFTAKYDSSNETLSFSSTIEENDEGALADGFWLVLSDGPDPKNDASEYAIFYADRFSGNLTAYVYDGDNSDDSYLTEPFISSFDGLSVTGDTHSRTFSFTNLDVSGVNSFIDSDEWDGASFDENIGIWFHPTLFDPAVPEYSEDGRLLTFGTLVTENSFFDVANFETVPEPAGIALFGTSLILLGAARRGKAKKA